MEKYKEILRYDKARLSQRQIADVLQVSRNTVSKTLVAAKAAGLVWDDVRELTELEVQERLFPHVPSEEFHFKPDYEQLCNELRKPGVTKKLLWEEYVQACHAAGRMPLQYSQFCVNFNRFIETSKATMHFEHTPGEKVEVDWAGQTLKLIDPISGKESKAYLFVSTLPYSRYSYVEVTGDMRQESWINAHVNMYQYFGGVTPLLICDNLKTGVIKHPRHGDIILNATYRELAEYYDTAILPAKPRTPKGKPSVEGTVGNVSTSILAKMRNQVFHTIYEANEAAQAYLEEFNDKPFQKRLGSRYEIFITEERQYLQPLPRDPYEYGEWKIGTVQYNYHISVDKMYYSVPFEFIKHKVKVRMTRNLVEVFNDQTRLCSHKRLYGHPGQYSTTDNHMPDNHRQAAEWDGKRFINWAQKIGESTRIVIERLLASYKVEQQAYNGCRSILKLSDQYSPQQLEAACKKALSIVHAPRYKNIKLILQANQTENKEQTKVNDDQTHAFLRGSQYFGKDDEK